MYVALYRQPMPLEAEIKMKSGESVHIEFTDLIIESRPRDGDDMGKDYYPIEVKAENRLREETTRSLIKDLAETFIKPSLGGKTRIRIEIKPPESGTLHLFVRDFSYDAINRKVTFVIDPKGKLSF